MKVLVTGATSGLGRNAVAFLAARPCAVRGTGRQAQVGASLQAQGVEFLRADLATAQTADYERLLDGVNAVWHCAALSSPWGRYQDFYDANVVATTRLAQAAVQHGVHRFVHISTPSLYFDYRHHTAIQETFQPARYANHYARTKAQAEHVIQEIARRHPDTTFTLLRPRGIFGPHDRVLLPRMLRVLHERKGKLPLPRGGVARLDLTYTENVVHAMWLATTVDNLRSGETFNITNGEPVILRDMAKAIFAPLPVACQIVNLPYALLDAAARAMEMRAILSGNEPSFTRYSIGTLNFDMTLEIEKARRLLGYQPVVSLAEGIHSTVRWIQSHGNDYGL